MSKLVNTFTVANSSGVKPWVLASDFPNKFTQEEIDTILQPSIDYMAALPGFISVSERESDDGLSFIRTYEFDTKENASNAQIITKINPPILKARADFLLQKFVEWGAQSHTLTSIVIE